MSTAADTPSDSVMSQTEIDDILGFTEGRRRVRYREAEDRLRWAYGLLVYRREPLGGSAIASEDNLRARAVDLAAWIGPAARELAEREG